jgi:Ca2+-binding RTX toxin-like protein
LAQSTMGTPSAAATNAVYFITDGDPNAGNTATAITNFSTFATTNNVKTYAVGVGTGIVNPTFLNNLHNVDGDGSGTKDAAIIVPDLNKLADVLLTTVPNAFGGNVTTTGGTSTVTFGADGGFISYIDIMLDSNSDGIPDTSVRFTYDPTTNQITENAAFLTTGFPVSGSILTLNSASKFTYGSLVFDFSNGDYTYFTQGQAVQGTQFDIGFQVKDFDGDTANAIQTVKVVDGKPVAVNDYDTILSKQTFFEGNVVTAQGTDGGSAGGLTTFNTSLPGADAIVDGATVTSVVFKGTIYNLTANSTGSANGGTYTVSSGKLTWTSTTESANQFVFDDSGYYKYTPPAVQTAAPPQNALTTVSLATSAVAATAAGLTLAAYARTDNLNTAGTAPTFTATGAGRTGGETNNTVDDLETLVITFNRTTHPQGVQNVTINFDAAGSNLGTGQTVTLAGALGGTGYSGVVVSVTISVFDISGNLLGQLSTATETPFVLPSTYSNIGRIEIEAGSPAQAIISGVSFNHINLNTTATGFAPETVQYTLTDTDGDTSTASLEMATTTNHYAGALGVTNDTITGSNANDYISGLDGNDSLSGGAGYDVIYGGAGNDTIDGGADNDKLYGGAGNDSILGGLGNDLINGDAGNDTLLGGTGADTIYGGTGNDSIDGGDGNDLIIGGAGNDTMIGGLGSDTFKWALADAGIKGTPAADTINGFDVAPVASGGDVLDLRDLLTGENHTVATGNLSSFLHFEKSGANTVIHVSSNGEYAAGFNAAKDVQTITLTGVDLVGTSTTDQQVIQSLLNNNKLITD